MKKISSQEIEELKTKGCSGDLEKIELDESVSFYDLKIENCEFIGRNNFYGKAILKKSVLKDVNIFSHSYVCESTVIDTSIGNYAMVQNLSIVKNSSVFGLTLKNATYPVIINCSQITKDVVLGGSDFNRTLSRGGSIFAFAHLGCGEFVRSTIIGTPPTDEVPNTVVEIGHFGYYGDLTVLGIAIKKDGELVLPYKPSFYGILPQALNQAYFGKKSVDSFELLTGRCNFGAGTTVSNYDPIRGTKAGAFFMLASCGANVTISPYLTVLPGSLISTGSVDITREKNVIAPNSLVITARDKGNIMDGYYDEAQKKILNNRTAEEVEYLIQDLKVKESLAMFFSGYNEGALDQIKKASKKSSQSVLKYFGLLEKSVAALEVKIKEKPEKTQKYLEKLYMQKKIFSKSREVAKQIEKIIDHIESINIAQECGISVQAGEIKFTKEQVVQLEDSLVQISDL